MSSQKRNAVCEYTKMTEKETKPKFFVDNNEVYERKFIAKFSMADCDDPEIYVAEPLLKWQESEQGSWVMKHGRDPTYYIHADPITYGYQVSITAHISQKRWTEYCLRFLS